MPSRAIHIEDLQVPPRRWRRFAWRVKRECCFLRAVWRQVWGRLLVIVAVLVGGGLLFQRYEPQKNHSLARAAYYTWSLVFGQPPEEFPDSSVLQAMFFIVPVLGLTVIIAGIVDFALLVGDRRRSERSWCVMMASAMSNHIVLVGVGRLGFRAFRMLRRLGEPVVVIERDPDNPFLEDIRRDGSPLLIGDARRESLLEQANVAQARSVVLATSDDMANLEIALDARRLVPNVRVVLRMFDQNMADKVREGFDIHLAMSQSALAAPAFVTAAIDRTIVNSMIVENRLVVMQRWLVADKGPLCGKTVADIMREYEAGVVEHRSGETPPRLFPPPDTRLQPGDQILVQGAFERLFHAAPTG